MEARQPAYLNVEQTVDRIIDCFGNEVRIGMPLGLGKPVALINALYRRAKNDPEVKLTIFTALSLEKPTWKSDLERRFWQPVVERTWRGVPDLDYMLDLRAGALPDNVTLVELFCKAGAYRKDPKIQQNYMSTNYTHTVRDTQIYDIGVFSQMLAKRETPSGVRYSTSCNADCSLETLTGFQKWREQGKRRLAIGVVNTHLPFMYGDAEVAPHLFDIIIDDPACSNPLFVTPRQPVSDADFMIGLHVSTLIRDGGTLQIGIGALGDAITYGLAMRNHRNEAYTRVLSDSGIAATYGQLIDEIGGTAPFARGLYGSTEMLVDGFLQLYKSGVIKRKVFHHAGVQQLINEGKLEERIPVDVLQQMIDREMLHPYLTKRDFEALKNVGVFREEATYEEGQIVCGGRRYSPLLADADNLNAISRDCLGTELKNGVILTGAFFIGPQDFYDTLNGMPEEERRQFEMTGVDVANQLYGNETLRALQRKDGRFCNTGMKATLLGHVSSDMLEDGTVISGVGGQYNFVSMAHALPDARLLMMIKSTRREGGRVQSNIVYNYGNVTIPRHLKDIVVTEYGIADIRGRCDQDVIKAMLNVADSRFQDELLAEAKRNKKIPEDYRIPERFRHNTPERLAEVLKDAKSQGLFPDYPFGSIFSREELLLLSSLGAMRAKLEGGGAAEISEIAGALPDELPRGLDPVFKRMGLTHPTTPEEKQAYTTLMLALKVAGSF